MKLYTSALLLVSSYSVVASVQGTVTPIEPVLVAMDNQDIDQQFYMGKYEVTVAEFQRFVQATGYTVPNKCMVFTKSQWPSPDKPGSWDSPELVNEPFRPVVCVGVQGAMDYAQWLTKETGKLYRLPTIEEYEFAALAGQKSRFAFGEDYEHSDVCEYENVEDRANIAALKLHHGVEYTRSVDCNDGAIYHTVVGMYRPNSFGLHDMLGNVRELTQTCIEYKKDDNKHCSRYAIGGSAWHWQPRDIVKERWTAADFIGSIEGFRLVLDAKELAIEHCEQFKGALLHAQKRARIEHNKLKSLPSAPKSLVSKDLRDQQVQLDWEAAHGEGVTYALYRSVLDSKGKGTRQWQLVKDGLSAPNYRDSNPLSSFISYKVHAVKEGMQSKASNIAYLGQYPKLAIGQKVEAEHYFSQRHSMLSKKDELQVVGLSTNADHHTPDGYIPFKPAWLKFDLSSETSSAVTVNVRMRGAKDTLLEFWQGHHLVARFNGHGGKEFKEVSVPGSVIKGADQLEIRSVGNNGALIDWFELIPNHIDD